MNAIDKTEANYCEQSASYSSTAGTLPASAGAGPSYAAQVPDARIDQQQQRHIASPHSAASSSAASHGHAYAPVMGGASYPPNAMGPGAAGLGIGPSAGPPPPPPDLRLTVPATTQATSWHQPSAHYSSDLSASAHRAAWFPTDYMSAAAASPAAGMPGSAQSYQSYARMPAPMSAQSMPAGDSRLMPLHDYDGPGQPTSSS